MGGIVVEFIGRPRRSAAPEAVVVALVILAGSARLETWQQTAAALPATLERYLASIVRLSQAERTRLLDGAPVSRLLDADASKEIHVVGVVWIAAPIERYLAAINDIENFERGGRLRLTRRISDPPRLDDFADLYLPVEDAADLRRCRAGSCDVKMSEQAMERFRTEIDWRSPGAIAAANALMRTLVFEYVTGYLAAGNARLPVYRDRSRPTHVADEFREMVAGSPVLTTELPDVGRYLLDFPHAPLPGSTSFLYWQETQFGLKPTIRLSHLVIRQRAEDTVIASKMLYATHYFWTALELRLLVPDPARGGFWFVMLNRSRSDGLSGFTGLFVRGHVRGSVQEGTLNALRQTKNRLERDVLP
jgi:hypothetical protein